MNISEISQKVDAAEQRFQALLRGVLAAQPAPEMAAQWSMAFDLFRATAVDLRAVLEDRAGLSRHTQYIGTTPEVVNGKPVVQLVTSANETIDLAVPAEVARGLRLGAVCRMAEDFKSIVGVTDGPPPFGTTSTIQAVKGGNGDLRYAVRAEHGPEEVVLPSHWLPRDRAVVGARVRIFRRCAYEVLDKEASTFAEGFRRTKPFGVAPGSVVGADQRRTIRRLIARVDAAVRPEAYRKRQRRTAVFLVTGLTGIGKSELLREVADVIRTRYDGVHIFALTGSSFRSSLVGGGTRQVKEFFEHGRGIASRPGQTVVVFVEEADDFMMARERSSLYLDGGASHQLTNQFLAELDSVATDQHGSFIVVLISNHPGAMDRASRSRMHVVPIKTFGEAELRTLLQKRVAADPDLYEPWGILAPAVDAALATPVGRVLVGKDSRDVRVGHVCTGRLVSKVCETVADIADELAFVGGEAPRVGPALLCTALVMEAQAEFALWEVAECRERLSGSDLCRAGRQAGLTDPTAIDPRDLDLAPDFDARGLIDALGQEE